MFAYHAGEHFSAQFNAHGIREEAVRGGKFNTPSPSPRLPPCARLLITSLLTASRDTRVVVARRIIQPPPPFDIVRALRHCPGHVCILSHDPVPCASCMRRRHRHTSAFSLLRPALRLSLRLRLRYPPPIDILAAHCALCIGVRIVWNAFCIRGRSSLLRLADTTRLRGPPRSGIVEA